MQREESAKTTIQHEQSEYAKTFIFEAIVLMIGL